MHGDHTLRGLKQAGIMISWFLWALSLGTTWTGPVLRVSLGSQPGCLLVSPEGSMGKHLLPKSHGCQQGLAPKDGSPVVWTCGLGYGCSYRRSPWASPQMGALMFITAEKPLQHLPDTCHGAGLRGISPAPTQLPLHVLSILLSMRSPSSTTSF